MLGLEQLVGNISFAKHRLGENVWCMLLHMCMFYIKILQLVINNIYTLQNRFWPFMWAIKVMISDNFNNQLSKKANFIQESYGFFMKHETTLLRNSSAVDYTHSPSRIDLTALNTQVIDKGSSLLHICDLCGMFSLIPPINDGLFWSDMQGATQKTHPSKQIGPCGNKTCKQPTDMSLS